LLSSSDQLLEAANFNRMLTAYQCVQEFVLLQVAVSCLSVLCLKICLYCCHCTRDDAELPCHRADSAVRGRVVTIKGSWDHGRVRELRSSLPSQMCGSRPAGGPDQWIAHGRICHDGAVCLLQCLHPRYGRRKSQEVAAEPCLVSMVSCIVFHIVRCTCHGSISFMLVSLTGSRTCSA